MHKVYDVAWSNQDVPTTSFAMERCALTDVRLMVTGETPPLTDCTLIRVCFWLDFPPADLLKQFPAGQDLVAELWPDLAASNTLLGCTVDGRRPLPRKERAHRTL